MGPVSGAPVQGPRAALRGDRRLAQQRLAIRRQGVSGLLRPPRAPPSRPYPAREGARPSPGDGTLQGPGRRPAGRRPARHAPGDGPGRDRSRHRLSDPGRAPDRNRRARARPLGGDLPRVQQLAGRVEEARRSVRELGAVALVLSNHPVNGRAWYDPAYEPLWAEAESLGVPVAFHGIQMAYQEHLGRRFMDNFVMAHAVAHPLEQMMALGSLLTGGVFERFPRLKAAFLEGSCSWVPWWLWTLDERVEKFGDDDRFHLTMRPSEYFRRNCWVSVDPDEDVVRHAIPTMGDDNIVISTDWPHDDSAYPRAVETFLGLEGVSETTKRKILWDNCARLYGLG
ncbi:MAG: hypothetical protein DMD75_07330 [Candidatus Rokuibacteriota bacterium]|nr:MAG: hypothetical protein DMD75_07330 [Candidatus Rokubacteria bacterium]